MTVSKLPQSKWSGLGRLCQCGKRGTFSPRGIDKRAEPWPTFQRCGDAAHLIEARVPLTADHLWKEAGRRVGNSQVGLTVPLWQGGQPVGASQGRGTFLCSPRATETCLTVHEVQRLRSNVDANAPGKVNVCMLNCSTTQQCPFALGRPPGGFLPGTGLWVFFPAYFLGLFFLWLFLLCGMAIALPLPSWAKVL